MSSKILDGSNPEGAHDAVMLGDRHVFAGYEMVPVEFEPQFIVIAALDVVVERPASATTMHEMPQLVLLTRPEALYAAVLPAGAPFLGQKPTILIEWRCKLITT